jgi:hypothetical protein
VGQENRRLPSPALVISVLALIVAVGGGAFAIAASESKQDRKIARIARKAVRKLAPKLSVKHAQTAGSATKADSADNATNAFNLQGQPASDFRLHCAADLHRAADLCFEFTERAPTSYTDALKTCALAQRRLPDEGELALVFDHLGAPQDEQWASGHYQLEVGGLFLDFGVGLSEDQDRNFTLIGQLATKGKPYRCVTSATNSP